MESYYNQTGKTIAVFGKILGAGPRMDLSKEATVIEHSIKSGIQDLHDVAIVDREYFDSLVRARKTLDMI